ncbi:hypothetical protein Pla22_28070 [Rubripirellula amarantea]|uniref:Uncharacterized protein n=1 Tax=Rubripirellula amarantea TaxID=2527999 RepID=A0A5C5WYS8_9BACT|nr:hypothetical protein [Rubripirellula amarantea]TWT55153.1 hypothetical protein Pla22_28070 [Rubripirellula amarantea]
MAHRFDHCDDHLAINRMRAEIERLEAEKSRLINVGDYRSAASVYDAEFAVRVELDTLLLRGREDDEPGDAWESPS